MTKESDHMKGLVELSGVSYRAAQARLAELLAREADLRRNLTQLTESRSAQVHAPRAPDEAALVAGADIRWHHWVDQRRATINMELAQVLALQENCRFALKKAFGRDQVAQSLLQQTLQADQQKQQRRKSYES